MNGRTRMVASEVAFKMRALCGSYDGKSMVEQRAASREEHQEEHLEMDL